MPHTDYSSVSVLKDIIFKLLIFHGLCLPRPPDLNLSNYYLRKMPFCKLSHELRDNLIINCKYFKNRKCQEASSYAVSSALRCWSVKYKFKCRGIRGALTLH